MFFQYDGLKQRVDTREALLVSVLGNEERNASPAQAFGVLVNHVVTHYLYIRPIVSQDIFAQKVGF